MTDNPPKSERPANCLFCNQQMFYMGDPRSTPELTIHLSLPSYQPPVTVEGFNKIEGYMFGTQKHYAHVTCWNTVFNFARNKPHGWENSRTITDSVQKFFDQ